MIRILSADDEAYNLLIIEETFKDMNNTQVVSVSNGQEVINTLNTDKNFDVILLDLNMPILSGLDVLRIIKNDKKFKYIPVIILTSLYDGKEEALSLGANDFLNKPYDIKELKLRTINYSKLNEYNRFLLNSNSFLEEKIKDRTNDILRAFDMTKKAEYEISIRLGKAAEFRDIESGHHIQRMSYYSAKLAELAKLSKDDVEIIMYASPLHDIGKVGIPDSILLKPGRFTDNEFEIMKKHTIIGAKILDGAEEYPILKAGRTIAITHHEKFDGSGYPYGLSKEEIPIFGRIVSIADVFDALTTKRIYKEEYSLEETHKIMTVDMKNSFDPELLKIFFNYIEHFLIIKKRYMDKNEISIQEHLIWNI